MYKYCEYINNVVYRIIFGELWCIRLNQLNKEWNKYAFTNGSINHLTKRHNFSEVVFGLPSSHNFNQLACVFSTNSSARRIVF